MHQSWISDLKKLGTDKNFDTLNVNLIVLKLGKTRSDYDKIKKGISNIYIPIGLTKENAKRKYKDLTRVVKKINY